MTDPLRVAIIGASGIGRHHANWHDAVGSDVVAFVGTTPERCHETAQSLAQLFGFRGKGYSSMDEMLSHERPDIVDICSPNATHYDAATRALEAGCHVLCEKPLVWDEDLSAEEMVEQAERLREIANRVGRQFGMCSQMAALLPQYDRFVGEVTNPRHFRALMETTAGEHPRTAREVWVDMGPHPISLILARYPHAQLDASTIRTNFEGSKASASFDVVAGEDRCFCEVTVSELPEHPLRRSFGFDEQCVSITGQPGDDGYYRAVLATDHAQDIGTDPMHLLIQQFTRAAAGDESMPLVSVEVAMNNLNILLEVAGHG